MPEYNFEATFEAATDFRNNQSDLQQQAIQDAFEILRAGGVWLQGDNPVPANERATLVNGVEIRTIPMNLDVTLASVIRNWREFRDLRSVELHDKSGIPTPRLSVMQNEITETVLTDLELRTLAKCLAIPDCVLITRRTPTELLQGVHYSKGHERSKLPKHPVHYARSYGTSLIEWGKFFGFPPVKLAYELDIYAGRMRSLSEGAVPQDLETLARKMQTHFHLPPGSIYTRTIPKDLVID